MRCGVGSDELRCSSELVNMRRSKSIDSLVSLALRLPLAPPFIGARRRQVTKRSSCNSDKDPSPVASPVAFPVATCFRDGRCPSVLLRWR